jgi:hypothetical protein
MARTKKQIENARKLIAALRELPDEASPSEPTQVTGDGLFLWDFGTIYQKVQEEDSFCGTLGCAMGLAQELKIAKSYDGFRLATAERIVEPLAKALGLSIFEAMRLFYGYGNFYEEHYFDAMSDGITPHMVAKQLERVLGRSP